MITRIVPRVLLVLILPIFVEFDGIFVLSDAAAQMGNMTDSSNSIGGNVTGEQSECPAGQYKDREYNCVSYPSNVPIECPKNQHATVNGICVSDITGRQISCPPGQRVTVNGTCISLHDTDFSN